MILALTKTTRCLILLKTFYHVSFIKSRFICESCPLEIINQSTSTTEVSKKYLYGGSVESILLTPMMSCLTPRVKARRACSRVWPFLEIPASNSPTPAATIRTAQSAWEVPVIMFLMKSRWPGASIMVT